MKVFILSGTCFALEASGNRNKTGIHEMYCRACLLGKIRFFAAASKSITGKQRSHFANY
jgi:hypothetical protein